MCWHITSSLSVGPSPMPVIEMASGLLLVPKLVDQSTRLPKWDPRGRRGIQRKPGGILLRYQTQHSLATRSTPAGSIRHEILRSDLELGEVWTRLVFVFGLVGVEALGFLSGFFFMMVIFMIPVRRRPSMRERRKKKK